jgi:5-methylcytosine-specific restriction protein A
MDNRRNAAERGYDARWQDRRKQYIQEHPLCELCMTEGRTRVAALVHHKHAIRQGGNVFPDDDGLMSVCRECHPKVERMLIRGV